MDIIIYTRQNLFATEQGGALLAYRENWKSHPKTQPRKPKASSLYFFSCFDFMFFLIKWVSCPGKIKLCCWHFQKQLKHLAESLLSIFFSLLFSFLLIACYVYLLYLVLNKLYFFWLGTTSPYTVLSTMVNQWPWFRHKDIGLLHTIMTILVHLLNHLLQTGKLSLAVLKLSPFVL